jgi:SNF2 family DNA or RNA helicase
VQALHVIRSSKALTSQAHMHAAILTRSLQLSTVALTRTALLQVLVYNGVKDTVEKGSVARHSSSKSSGSSSASAAQQPFALLSAPFLAQHDVVLTTYDVLRSEVHHAAAARGAASAGSGRQQQSSGRTTRYAKPYKVVPSPLTALRWWRVAIDEAQMVETTTTRK